jgi:hypothetical protein
VERVLRLKSSEWFDAMLDWYRANMMAKKRKEIPTKVDPNVAFDPAAFVERLKSPEMMAVMDKIIEENKEWLKEMAKR